jgi:II/X family phage/plasmid replication protein
MFDTIKVRSPVINDLSVLERVYNFSVVKSALDVKSGEYIYRVVSVPLEGSFDNRISVRLLDDGRVVIEGSINKLIMGHNLFGVEDLNNVAFCARFMIRWVEQVLGVSFPLYLDWEVMRLDWAVNYKIGEEAVKEWFVKMNNIYYPRRKVVRHDLSGLMFPGTTTTLKFYDKYKEFERNDFRVLRQFNIGKAFELLDFAKGILRIELEIKKKKLMYDLDKDEVLVRDVINYDFEGLFEREILKVLKVGKEMKICNDSLGVRKRLRMRYGERLGTILYSTWLRLSIEGYESVMRDMSKATFYRHIKQLKDAGVSWLNTDVVLESDNTIPLDFMFREEYKKMVV